MKNKTLLLLAMFALPFTAQAGGSELHGGDSVVCFQNPAQKQQVEKTLRQNKVASQMGYIRQDPFDGIDLNTVTVETLDIWETIHTSTSPRKFIDVKNVDEAVKERITVLKSKSAAMAGEMQKALDGFYAPSKWLASPTGVVEIDDSRELINYTKLCIPVQIAVQTNTRVYYDGRLFSRMNATNKVALILHEILYSWLKRYSENSLNVRKYIGLMMLEDFASYPTDSLIEEFKVDYPKVEINMMINCSAKAIVEGVEIRLHGEIEGPNASICEDRSLYKFLYFTNLKEDLKPLSEKLGLEVGEVSATGIHWLESGYLRIDAVRLKDNQTLMVNEVATPFKMITDYTSLRVIHGVVDGLPDRANTIEILGQEIKLKTYSFIYKQLPNGQSYLSSFAIDGDYTLKSLSGYKKVKKCKTGMTVYLNPNGLVTECKYE